MNINARHAKHAKLLIALLLTSVVILSQGTVFAVSDKLPDVKNDECCNDAVRICDLQNSISFNNQKYEINETDSTTIYMEITSEKEIAEFAKLHGAINNRNMKITKIELVEVLPSTVYESSGDIGAMKIRSWDIYNREAKAGTCIDYGTGWYFPDSPKWDMWWEGPDTAYISQTISENCAIYGSGGASYSGITAVIGFNVSSSYSVTYSSTTPVPADKLLEVKVYTVYHRKSCDIWEYHWNTPPHYYDTCNSYKPLGSYFVKFWYDS